MRRTLKDFQLFDKGKTQIISKFSVEKTDTLDAVVAWLNGTDRDWPDAIPVAETVDAGLLARRLRMAAVWSGPGRLGAYRAGDGAASVVVELVGEHATLILALVVAPASGVLHQADILP